MTKIICGGFVAVGILLLQFTTTLPLPQGQSVPQYSWFSKSPVLGFNLLLDTGGVEKGIVRLSLETILEFVFFGFIGISKLKHLLLKVVVFQALEDIFSWPVL